MADIDSVWPKIRAAFAFYGRKISPVCGPSRRKLIEKRLAEGYSPQAIVRAVDGYCHFHEGLDQKPGEDFNPRKWFDPDSVFKAERFDTRVELGEQGRWVHVDPRVSHEQQVKARQAAAQKRVDEARAARDTQSKSRLRAV